MSTETGEVRSDAAYVEENLFAADRDVLFQSLYSELKIVARSRLRTVGGRTSLDTTMLVHDTYARLAQTSKARFESNGQFLAYCGKVMRSVIIDLARERLAQRRGGGELELPLNTEIAQSAEVPEDDSLDVLRVHGALSQLNALDPRLETIVEMRYFGGLSEPETAAALGLSVRTVSREWQRARALLRAMLSE